MTGTIDITKAIEVMRQEGLETWTDTSATPPLACGYTERGDLVYARKAGAFGGIEGRTADDMEAQAALLLRMAAVCRRIEAECRVPEVKL